MISDAARGLTGISRVTPLFHSETFSRLLGGDIYFKAENLQKTGSFKLRGAFNKIRLLEPDSFIRGVVAASAGNHGQGVAYSACHQGIKVKVVMPSGAPASKIQAVMDYGAEVILAGDSYDAAYLEALRLQEQEGLLLIHAFNDPAVIAGQGTVGMEVMAHLPDTEVIMVPVGGGGLLAGVAVAIKSMHPQVEVIGVQAENFPGVSLYLESGKLVTTPCATTMADGIAVQCPGVFTLPLIQKYVDQVVTVAENDIAQAMLLLLERQKTVVEGAGAVGLAALLAGKTVLKGRKTVVVLSGGNVDVQVLARVIERGLVLSGRRLRLCVHLPDRPGSLQRLLALVAAAGANVLGVHHDRLSPTVSPAEAQVVLNLETRSTAHAEHVKETCAEHGFIYTLG